MKKCILCILALLLLNGCTNQPKELETGLELRSKLQNSSGCSFTAQVTADYGDKLHEFTLECDAASDGNVFFCVQKPDSISGICGNITSEGGAINFTDTALHFPLLIDEQLSPISAPWILIHCITGGYLASSCMEGERMRLSIDDHYEEIPLRIDVWLDMGKRPDHAEILFNGRRILSMNVADFLIL